MSLEVHTTTGVVRDKNGVALDVGAQVLFIASAGERSYTFVGVVEHMTTTRGDEVNVRALSNHQLGGWYLARYVERVDLATYETSQS